VGNEAGMAGIAVYATDLHGGIMEYERLLTVGSGKNVRAVLIGGDICPFLTAAGDIAQSQGEFIQFYLIPRLREFQKKTGKDVFLIMGNDDVKVNKDLVEKGGAEGAFTPVNMKAVPFGDKFIAGYSHINEAPFLLKDWEKSEEEILADLRRLAKKSDPKKTIYMMHAPPFGTPLDIIYSGRHVGSMAIRRFIEEAKPLMTLHGHIHESPQMSGDWKDVISGTVCLNPGKGSIVVFDVDNPVATMQRL
jgi:uncharacterized protein